MQASLQALDLRWATLDQAHLPSTPVAGLKIVVSHSTGITPWDQVRQAMTKEFGAPNTERRRMNGIELRWATAAMPATMVIGRRKVTVSATNRLNAKKVRRLVGALHGIPSITGVRLTGHIERFGPAAMKPMLDG